MLETRIKLHEVQPDAFKAMLGLEGYVDSTDLDKRLRKLIKIRASQLNNCAYCINMHTDEARKLGETDQRMHALSAWQESPLFSEVERCVLAVTDEVTLIASGGLSPKTYAKALELLGESQLAQCIMQIVTINTWNRIAVSTKLVYE